MPHVTGPQFIALQVENLEAAKQFYTEQLGLIPTDQGPEHAVVFQYPPHPFCTSYSQHQSSRQPSAGMGRSALVGVRTGRQSARVSTGLRFGDC